MNNLFRVFCIVIIDTLGCFYLPFDTFPQFVCSISILIYLALGIYAFENGRCRFSVTDALTCVPCILLMINYLIWDSLLRIITNIFIISLSTMGLYCYINSKKYSPN